MICRKLEECINGELQSNSLEECDNKTGRTVLSHQTDV